MAPDITIYHNPDCSKSQAAMAALRAAGIQPTIRLYLEDPPDAEEVIGLARKVGDWKPLLRDEGIAPELRRRPDTTVQEAAAVVARDPAMLQRPILVHGDHAVVARDPATLQAFIKKVQGE